MKIFSTIMPFSFLITFLYFILFVYQVCTVLSNPATTSLSTGKQIAKRQTAPGICIPLSVINGQVNYLQTNLITLYSSGTTAVLTCNLGFIISGQSNSICTNSIWTPPLGTCNLASLGVLGTTINNCFPQIAPFNGQLIYSQGGVFGPFPFGTSVSLRCNPGSVISGIALATCSPNGMWDPTNLGQCSSITPLSLNAMPSFAASTTSAVKCVAIPSPLNGRIFYSIADSSGYLSGTIATLLCEPGFISSQITSICNPSGLWSPLIGSCKQIGTTIQNTVQNDKSPTTGMMPSFFATNINGQCLLGLIPPLGATVKYSQGSMMGPYPSGTIATLSCNSGKTIGSSTSICNNNTWNPLFLQGCSMSDDSALQDDQAVTPTPNNMILSSLQPMAMGSLTFTSAIPQVFGAVLPNNGFDVMNTGITNNGIKNNVAMPDSVTSTLSVNSGPQCIFGIPPITTGTITYSQGGLLGPYPVGTVANLQCTSGSAPIGATTANCINGSWSPVILEPCNAISSNGLGAGLGQSNIATNSLGMFGAVLTTPANNILGNGNITPPTPSLTPMGNIMPNQNQQQCILGVLVSLNGRVTYSEENKKFLPNMPPGMIGPYSYGTTAELTCNTGFVVSGVSTSTCKDGLFQPPLGLCIVNIMGSTIGTPKMADFPEPEVMADATNSSLFINLPNNSSMTLQKGCPNLALEEAQKGKIIYSISETTTMSSSGKRPMVVHHLIGTLATLECNSGYSATGSVLTMCEAQGWTMPVLGDCKKNTVAKDEPKNAEASEV